MELFLEILFQLLNKYLDQTYFYANMILSDVLSCLLF